jgi:hypothetical protein
MGYCGSRSFGSAAPARWRSSPLRGDCGPHQNDDGKTIADQAAFKKTKHCSILANAAARAADLPRQRRCGLMVP